MKRLFFGLWPNQVVRQQCSDIIAELEGAGRPVAATNLHVTLLFLGNISVEQQQKLSNAAAQLQTLAIDLKFDQLVFWKKPSILCLTTDAADQNILNLNRQLAAIARSHHIPIDEKPFRPHITLIKKAKLPIDLEFEPVQWRANGFCLAESVSIRSGVEYRILKHWPLTPKTGD